MRIRLPLILFTFISCASCYAQQDYRPAPDKLPFEKFITNRSVEYAVCLVDTVRFKDVNLNALLRRRFKNNEIKVSAPIERGYGNYGDRFILKYISQSQIDSLHFYHDTEPDHDPVTNSTIPAPLIIPANLFDSISYNLVEMAQIFYVEKGELHIYIPWVSPDMSVITDRGTFLGISHYFSTAFNFNRKFTPGKKDKILDLGYTKTMIRLDSIPKRDMLKQLYGNNMLEAIWKELFTGRKVYYAIDNTELQADERSLNLEDNIKISVPLYDSLGNITGSVIQAPRPLVPSDFSAMEIVQEQKYDITRNIITGTITEIILIGNYRPDPETEPQARRILRIVY